MEKFAIYSKLFNFLGPKTALLIIFWAFQNTAYSQVADSYSVNNQGPLFEFLKQIPSSVHSVDEFAPHFDPKQWKSLLVRQSKSVQPSTEHHPRVILYNNEASLILAYGQSPQRIDLSLTSRQLKQLNAIEVIQFNKNSAEFEFFELRFNDRGWSVSEKNPSLCMSCHKGPDPRPNWDHYPRWPGVYGEFDGQLTEKEKSALINFYDLNKKNPRYSPVINGLQSAQDLIKKVDNNKSVFDFTERIFYWNALRMIRQMQSHPNWSEIKYFVTSLLAGCSDKSLDYPRRFVPDNIFYSLVNRFEVLKLAEENFGVSSNSGLFRSQLYFSDNLAAHMESLGFNTWSWFLNLETGPHMKWRVPIDISANFLSALWQREPTLRPLLNSKSFGYRNGQYPHAQLNMTCGELSKISSQSLEKISIKIQNDIEHSPSQFLDFYNFDAKKMIQSCNKCHEEDGLAPIIPINNPSEIDDRWIEKIRASLIHTDLRKKMPKNGPYLTSAQQEKLILYLESIRRSSNKVLF